MIKLVKNVRGILDGEFELTNVRKYSVMAYFVCAVHFILLLFFSYFHIIPLMIFNVFSVILYLIMHIFIKKEKYTLTFLTTYGEICLHTIFAICILGGDTAFLFYNFALVPVSYYMSFMSNAFKKKILHPIILMFINFLLTIFCTVYRMFGYAPTNVLTKGQSFLLSVFNISVVFLFLSVFSVLFVVEIRTSQQLLRRQNMKLNYYAQYDSLTSLLNRRSMEEKIVEILKEAQEKNEKFCVVMADIDDFKRVNDIYGHECGDKALVHIAATLNGLLLPEDSVSRWGGEEFLFVLKGSEVECRKKTEIMRSAIEKIDFYYKNRRVKFTMTFGVQEHRLEMNIERTISMADDKLYKGKESGKNCVIV